MSVRAQFDTVVIDANGNVLDIVEATVKIAGTQNNATLYTTKSGGGTMSNPITTGATGIIQFWAEPGSYDITFHDTDIPARIADRTFTWESLSGEANGVPQSKIDGLVSALAANAVPIGTILPYGGTSAPTNFFLCNGSEKNRTTYSTLYNIIGTNFGVGDGSSTFNVPDLVGRAPIGAGQGSGLSNRVLGNKSGFETHQLTIGEMPSHDHVSVDVILAPGQGVNWAGSGASFSAATRWMQPTGGGGSHNNMQPYQVVNYVIRYQ